MESNYAEPGIQVPKIVSLSLLVISGAQRGASTKIEPGQVTLGAGFDSDIIINDGSIAEHALKLECNENQITITALSDDAVYQQKKLAPGMSTRLELYNPVTVGGTQFIVGDSTSFEWQSYLDAPMVTRSDDMPAVAPAIFSNSKSLTVFSTCCLFAVAVVVLVTSRVTQVEAAPSELEAVRSLQESVAALSLDQLVIVNENGAIQVSGFVRGYQDYQLLLDAIAQWGPGANVNVSIGEKVAADIDNIFRTNGLQVEVVSVSPTLAVVNVEAGDAILLEKIKNWVLADVAEIENLTINNVTAPSGFNHDAILKGPGKQIITVVQGELAYFVTADKSRYFIGSQLPSGYTVEAISKDQLLLSLGDKTLNLPI